MKNNKGQLSMGGVIMLAVLIILGAVFFSAIINEQTKLTDLQPVADETTNLYTVGCNVEFGEVNESSTACNITVAKWTDYDSDWRTGTSQCYPTSIVVTNASGTALTLDTDYSVSSAVGIVRLLNTTDTQNDTMGNSVLIDYNYCDAGYNKDSGARGIARLPALFFALAILAAAYMGIKEFGN